MTMMIGQLEPLKPQFVLKSFNLVKNTAGNLVVRAESVNYRKLRVVKSFNKNVRVNARRQCSSGGMAGFERFTTCSYQIDVNEKYIGKAERCEEVPYPMGFGSMTMLVCYDENGKMKSSQMVSSTSDYRTPEINVVEKEPNNQAKAQVYAKLFDKDKKRKKNYWIIGGIAVAGIAYFMFIKK